jgi:DNA-nicking Smr family endonuclease
LNPKFAYDYAARPGELPNQDTSTMSRRRQVSEEEEALWRAVTRSVSPLKRRRKEIATNPDRTKAARVEAKHKPSPRLPLPASITMPKTLTPKSVENAAPKPPHPALAPLERRAKQRLARGTEAIDARIDLHGRTQNEAHAALLRFLHRAQANGARTVLVITGKGRTPTSERGVLKRQVPMWLSLPEFRDLVVGFGDAAIGHGGEGALYVRVRRARGGG